MVTIFPEQLHSPFPTNAFICAIFGQQDFNEEFYNGNTSLTRRTRRTPATTCWRRQWHSTQRCEFRG